VEAFFLGFILGYMTRNSPLVPANHLEQARTANLYGFTQWSMSVTERDDRLMNEQFREQFYPRTRQSIPAAREFTRRALKDWGFVEPSDDVALCVSELATNALLHGVPPGRGFRLVLRMRERGVLRIEVHDSGDGQPRVRCGVAERDESGRGLLLVSALADTWGVGERDPGKIVWCEWDLSARPRPSCDGAGSCDPGTAASRAGE
jgi:anti-sigma regulatory factor (Ser/Thr protein kinase)